MGCFLLEAPGEQSFFRQVFRMSLEAGVWGFRGLGAFYHGPSMPLGGGEFSSWGLLMLDVTQEWPEVSWVVMSAPRKLEGGPEGKSLNFGRPGGRMAARQKDRPARAPLNFRRGRPGAGQRFAETLLAVGELAIGWQHARGMQNGFATQTSCCVEFSRYTGCRRMSGAVPTLAV